MAALRWGLPPGFTSFYHPGRGLDAGPSLAILESDSPTKVKIKASDRLREFVDSEVWLFTWWFKVD